MKVYTRQESRHITRDEIRFAAYFIMGYLVNEDLHNQLEVTIIHRPFTDPKKVGLTWLRDVRDKLRYNVQIDPALRRTRQLITLAHELVHVKQFAMGELGPLTDNKKDGRKISSWMKQDFNENDVEHWDWPWEIEANGREYGLYKRYTHFINEHPHFISPKKI